MVLPGVMSRDPIVAAAARVTPQPAVGDQLGVRADLDFVRGEHIGCRRDPAILDHLDGDQPAVLRRLHPDDALWVLASKLDDFPQAMLPGLAGGELRLLGPGPRWFTVVACGPFGWHVDRLLSSSGAGERACRRTAGWSPCTGSWTARLQRCPRNPTAAAPLQAHA